MKVTDSLDIWIGGRRITHGTRTIIGDILLFCSNLTLILLYLEFICIIFRKYRVSFRLDKCEFLKDRTKYVGYDITSKGNCPAQSKFDTINDWKLPDTGQSLFYFIVLINFCHRFVPYLELKLKPLRCLCRTYYQESIPTMTWTPSLIKLFEDMKVGITSSPVLSRFDYQKPTFLNTNWISEGMGWILMQPDNDIEYITATVHLLKTV